MRRPSIRRRLMFGCILVAGTVLGTSKVAIYHEIEHSLREKLDEQLLRSASLLSKSAELEAHGIIYEWQEALESSGGLGLEGLFQFWDLASNTTTRSPDLGERDLEFFHGAPDQPEFRDIVSADGVRMRAVSIWHRPFINPYGREEMRRRGKMLSIEDHPQVVICAKETSGLERELAARRLQLAKTGLVTLAAICGAIYLIIRWTFAPLDRLVASVVKRSSEAGAPVPEVPADLPVEVVPLAVAFNSTLERVEQARAHEKEFAFSAAHQLRTPVAGVHAILELALSKPKDGEDLHRRIGTALSVTREIRSIIGSLMSLARLRGNIEQMSMLPYRPGPLVLSILEASKAERTEEVTVLTEGLGQDLLSLGDEGLFRMLAANLIENALRYTPCGGQIRISMRSSAGRLVLGISNSRGEFSPEEAERVFRPFERGHHVSVNHPGAGLGLPLARELAKWLGGTLELSFTDTEATFTFEVPDSSHVTDYRQHPTN